MSKMRRQDRAMTAEESIALLEVGEYGVLSTADKEGQPYGVPLNYVYKDNVIYFHSALDGHKLDNLRQNAKVSFCVVGRTRVLPEKFSTAYESVLAFGAAVEIDGEEKKAALIWLLEKYCPDYLDEGHDYVRKDIDTTRVIKLQVEQVSGKARR